MPRSLLVLLLPVLLAACAFATPYTHLWWAEGFHTADPAGPRALHLRTNAYAAAFDTSIPAITALGPPDTPATYLAAAMESNEVFTRLPPAALQLRVTVDGTTYTCTAAARNRADHANYPVRLIEGGRWFHRFDVLGLEFTDPGGRPLDAEAWLEVAAWPDRLQLSLEVAPTEADTPAIPAIELRDARHAWTSDPPDPAAPRVARLVWTPTGPHAKPGFPPGIVTATDARDANAPLPVRFDPALAAYTVALPPRQWSMADDLDRLDRFPLTTTNPTDQPRAIPLVFEFDGPFQGITGMSPVLRDADGHPTGIPVQISKNWHRLPDRPMRHQGPWFRGAALLPLPPGGTWTGELAIAYARWGGVPAASHAQLSLVGWGGNQRWDQAAIGSFGESICYDPDIGLNRSIIDDIRPLLVTGMRGDRWTWTHNVGGGDFLVLHDAADTRQPLVRMRTAYLAPGPNLTHTVYAGHSADGAIDARLDALTPRTDDLHRAYHRLRYDVRAPVDFTRLAFYQLGADRYNDHQFARIARGNADGLLEEWDTERGGKRYLREGIPVEGPAPWFALLGGTRSPQWDQGAWADRALVLRHWRARLGGVDIPHPTAAVYGTENGPPSANLELAPPPGLTRLLPGDFVEAEIELLVLPQSAADYYGPNAALRASVEADGGTWRAVHRLAQANHLDITVAQGRLLRRLPVEIAATPEGHADLTLTGGAGHLPITFTGLPSPTGHTILLDGVPLDQAIHGNDYWQIHPDPNGATWAHTINLPADPPVPRHIQLRPTPPTP